MRDAVMVIPGIMGSELRDSDGRLLWGASARVLGAAWARGEMAELHVTPDELERGSRLRATGLLHAPGWAPFLRGLLPYSKLTEELTRLCHGDRRAVATFPYDWRMGIDTHTSAFTDACSRHLASWTATVAAERLGDPAGVRLVVVAHSMGGLIARLALKDSELAGRVRLLTTLGTPFYGSINAVQMLAAGADSAPIPVVAARDLALTCPGVYDLLPRYRCVMTAPLTYRTMTDGDVVQLGGDASLARAASGRWEQLSLVGPSPSSVPHIAIAGVGQPTAASLSIKDGVAETSPRRDGTVDHGDATVWRRAATPEGTTAIPVPQRHAALAVSKHSLLVLRDKILDLDSKHGLLGTRPIGIDLPDTVAAGSLVTVSILEESDGPGAAPGNPVGIRVTSKNLEGGPEITWSRGRREAGNVVFTRPGLPPGLHQVSAHAGGHGPVTEIILVRDTR